LQTPSRNHCYHKKLFDSMPIVPQTTNTQIREQPIIPIMICYNHSQSIISLNKALLSWERTNIPTALFNSTSQQTSLFPMSIRTIRRTVVNRIRMSIIANPIKLPSAKRAHKIHAIRNKIPKHQITNQQDNTPRFANARKL